MIRENSNSNVEYIPTKEEVLAYLSDHVKSGDLVITMGAGDIWKTAVGLARLWNRSTHDEKKSSTRGRPRMSDRDLKVGFLGKESFRFKPLTKFLKRYKRAALSGEPTRGSSFCVAVEGV